MIHWFILLTSIALLISIALNSNRVLVQPIWYFQSGEEAMEKKAKIEGERGGGAEKRT